MDQNMSSKRVAVLVEDGFEEVELTEPVRALKEAGARTEVISPKEGKVKAWRHDRWGVEVPVDTPLDAAKPEQYDALLLPGGVMNPDKLRMNDRAVRFVQSFVQAQKPIFAICHGPWTLIEARGVAGRRMTSWPSLKTDLTNAGARWVDETVVVDQGLVTSRKPADLPEFNKKMLEELAEGVHRREEVSAGRMG